MDGQKATRKPKAYSLDDEHIEWVKERSRKEGHGNESRVVQRLIEWEAMQRDGFDWREKVRADAEAVPA